MYKNLTKVGAKEDTRYGNGKGFRVWMCKWLHRSVANPHKLAVIQVKANTPSQVPWFIISGENRLQIFKTFIFLGIAAATFGPDPQLLCMWDSANGRIGPYMSCDCKFCCQALLTKSMPTPFCFLVTNSHCKKVSTCVMAKAKAVPKCFSCKILECCLQCQWVLVKSFGVGSLSSFCWIRWGDWYQKPWINFKSFYYLAWFVKNIKHRSFPFRKLIYMKDGQIFINQIKTTRLISFFFFPTLVSQLIFSHPGGPWWWNIQLASQEVQQFRSCHPWPRVIQLQMDSISFLGSRSKAFICEAKYHIHLCAAGCLQ